MPPPGARNVPFSYKANGIPTRSEGKPGSLVLQPNCNAVNEWATFDKGHSSLIVFPCPDFDNPPQLLPYRASSEQYDYQGWLYAAEGVVSFGSPGVTMLFDYPDDAGYNKRYHHPIYLICNAIHNAKKKGERIITPFGDNFGWAELMLGAPGKGAPVKWPSMLHFVQGILVAHQGQPLAPPKGIDGDPTVVFGMTEACGKKMTTLLEARDPNFNGPEDDLNQFTYRNAVGGMFLHVYGCHKGVPGIVDPNNDKGYGCTFSRTINGHPAGATVPNDASFAQLVHRKFKPWHEVIRKLSDDECAAVASKALAEQKGLLWHAWKGHPEWLPDEIKSAAVGRVSAEISPYQQPAQQPGYMRQPPAAAPAQPQQQLPWGGTWPHDNQATQYAPQFTTPSLTPPAAPPTAQQPLPLTPPAAPQPAQQRQQPLSLTGQPLSITGQPLPAAGQPAYSVDEAEAPADFGTLAPPELGVGPVTAAVDANSFAAAEQKLRAAMDAKEAAAQQANASSLARALARKPG